MIRKCVFRCNIDEQLCLLWTEYFICNVYNFRSLVSLLTLMQNKDVKNHEIYSKRRWPSVKIMYEIKGNDSLQSMKLTASRQIRTKC